jgi:hypothetical protein
MTLMLNASIGTKEPPRPCKRCGNLSVGQTCLAAARGQIEGAPRDYQPGTAEPRRCLSYIPPDFDRDEILRYDRRTGWDLWPEVVALVELQVDCESALGKAIAFLAGMLDGNQSDVGELIAAAQKKDITERTLQRAAVQLGVVKTKAGFSGGWTWAMPLPEAA